MPSNYIPPIRRMAVSDAQKGKVKLILDAADMGSGQNVPDPYWDDDGFEQVFQMLDIACEGIIEKYS